MTSTSGSGKASSGFSAWLRKHNISLIASTYRANRLIFIGSTINGQLKLHERLYDRPMGLFTTGSSFWLAGRSHLWRFDNFLDSGQVYDGADQIYVPAASFLTGEVNAHEVVVPSSGSPLFVNTVFSCLAEIKTGCSFKSFWQPPFIDALVPEDRCHLNGVALKDDEVTWVTSCSSDNHATSWRNQRVGGGVVIHVPSGEIQCSNLTMPHSPRWYGDRLWLLNSGTGELGWVENNVFHPHCQLPGFIRGLAFHGGYAIVGLSKLRSNIFTGLPLEERLQKSSDSPEGFCGLRVVELLTGRILHALDFPEPIDELFDLSILSGVREPRALSLKDESLDCLVKIPGQPELIQIRPTTPSGSPYEGPEVERLGLPASNRYQSNDDQSVRYQRVYQLTPDTLAPYAQLTYPSLAPGSSALKRLKGELLGISAMRSGSMIGLIIAELKSDSSAVVVSFKVADADRGQGIGTRLLAYLSLFLKQEGTHRVSLRYRAPFQGSSPMPSLLQRVQWPSPQQDFLLLKSTSEQLNRIDWDRRFPLPTGYAVVPWSRELLPLADLIDDEPVLKECLRSPLIDLTISTALMYRNQLVGWMIADRINQLSVRYSCVFVQSKHRQRGQSLHLIAATVHRQHNSKIPVARFAIASASQSMMRLAQRHLLSYVSDISRSMVVDHALESSVASVSV